MQRRPLTIGLLLAATATAAAATAASARTHHLGSTRPVQTQTVVQVPSDTVDWFIDSGIQINAGETFSISATGSVYWGGSSNPVGPAGLKFTSRYCATNQYLDPSNWASTGLNCYSLIGRIGNDNNVVFLVGSNFKLKSPIAGELYLGFNDDYPYDNNGDFTATVTTP